MKDEQRAALAIGHLEKASELIDKLCSAGALELEGAQENIVDVLGLLGELDFEEGNLVTTAEPLLVGADEEDAEDGVEDFREDVEEE